MDPNATLAEIRRRNEEVTRGIDVRRNEREIRWLFIALDEWITKGGFLPTDWSR